MESLKMFTEAQHAVDEWIKNYHKPSQAEFWKVLGVTYKAYRKALVEPEALEMAAAHYDLKVRKDAFDRVATLVLKVVIRPEVHQSLSSGFAIWAKVLVWLHQHDIDPTVAARVIGDSGGVEGVRIRFNKENSKARAGDPKPVVTAKIAKEAEVFPRLGTVSKTTDGAVLTISNGKDVKTLEALGQQPGYILLVARVDENFELSDLRVIDRDEEKISRIVATRSRAMAAANAAVSNDNDIKKEAV